MKLKPALLLVLIAVAALAFAGCAQDSTNTSDDNPQMQEDVMKGDSASAATGASTDTSSTDTTRTPAMGGTGGTKVALSADPNGDLKYNTDKLNAKPGNITVAFKNASNTLHDVAIATSGGKTLGTSKEITGGSTALVIKDVKAGSYTFFCTLPGHKDAGMVGTLTVR
jgi:plastocyanin